MVTSVLGAIISTSVEQPANSMIEENNTSTDNRSFDIKICYVCLLSGRKYIL
jgi:hypothetical protein